MSNEVAGAIERVSSGNHAIHEREHTVVLGWTQQTLPLIKQVGGGQEHTVVLGWTQQTLPLIKQVGGREHTVVLGWTQQTLPLIKQVGERHGMGVC